MITHDISRRSALKLGAAAAVAASMPTTALATSATAAAATTPTSDEEWTGPPVVVRVSERVPAGGVLTFYGEGFDPVPANNTILVQALSGTSAPATPPAGASSLTAIQADPGGHFIRVMLTNPGPLVAWVSTTNGQSQPILVNTPDPRWLSTDEAYPGMAVYLCGRNLDPQGYGTRGRTEIQLVDQDGHPAAPRVDITELSSYHAVFTTPEVPPGPYTVCVRTSPNNPWVEFTDEPLTVVAATATVDPLNLGVAWTRDFAWTNVHQVTEYGAVGDGTTDDTTAIQTGIEALGNAGGGVLCFPAGTYRHSGLAMPAGVVLQGRGEGRSTLEYFGTRTFAIISEGDGITIGKGGFTDLRFTYAEGMQRTDRPSYFWIGEPTWNVFPTPGSGRFFFHRTQLDIPMDDVTYSAAGCVVTFDNRVAIVDNDWTGAGAVHYMPFVNDYVLARDNTYDLANGAVALCASHQVVVRNEVSGQWIDGVSGAGSFRAFEIAPAHVRYAPTHLYFGGNTVRNWLSVSNSGESFNCEDAGQAVFYSGSVIDATTTSLVVSVDSALFAGSTWTDSDWQVMISSGRGMGQLRDVTAHSDDNTNLTIGRPWEVVPDGSSQYVVLRPMRDIVIEKNTVSDCSANAQFYYTTYDSVIAELSSHNADGAATWGRIHAGGQNNPVEPVFFTTIRDSNLSGESALLQDLSVSMRCSDQISETIPTAVAYGTEIINNTVDRTACPTTSGGRPQPSGIQVSFAQQGITGQGAVATLVAGNHVANSEVGIDIDAGVDGTVFLNNTFSNVTTPIYDSGSTNTLSI